MSEKEYQFPFHFHIPSLRAFAAYSARSICDEFCPDNPPIDPLKALKIRSKFDQGLMDWLEDFYCDFKFYMEDLSNPRKYVDAFWLAWIQHPTDDPRELSIYDLNYHADFDICVSLFSHYRITNSEQRNDIISQSTDGERNTGINLAVDFIKFTRKFLQYSESALPAYEKYMGIVTKRLQSNLSRGVYRYILSLMLLSFPSYRVRNVLITLGADIEVVMNLDEYFTEAERLIIAAGTGQYDYVGNKCSVSDPTSVNTSIYFDYLESQYSPMTAAIEADDSKMITFLFDLGAVNRVVNYDFNRFLPEEEISNRCDVCRCLVRNNLNALRVIVTRTDSWNFPHLYRFSDDIQITRFLIEETNCPVTSALLNCSRSVEKLIYVLQTMKKRHIDLRAPLIRERLVTLSTYADITVLDYLLTLPVFTSLDYLRMLVDAVGETDGRRLRRILSSDMVARAIDISTTNLFAEAALSSNIGVSELLLSAGCKINDRQVFQADDEPLTPLMWFCHIQSHLQWVSCHEPSKLRYLTWMISKGANVYDTTTDFRKAIDMLGPYNKELKQYLKNVMETQKPDLDHIDWSNTTY